MTLKFGSLFAGVGGFDCGFERAGMHCAWQAEKDKACRSVLARHFPTTTIFDDVRAVGKDSPPIDVPCGGWPCQDLSVAGKRAGLAGERSGLFHEYIRVADECRPTVCVFENVPGLLSSERGGDMASVLREFCRIGYCGAWRVLDSQYFGLAQRRRRVFGVFVGEHLGAGRAAEILSLREGVRGHPSPSREAGKAVAALTSNGVGTCGADDNQAQAGHLIASFGERNITSKGNRSTVQAGAPCHTLHEAPPSVFFPIDMRQASRGDKMTNNRREGSSGGAPGTGIGNEGDPCPTLADSHTPAVAYTSGVRRLTPTECERLQGFDYGWTAGQPDSTRYKQIGNAVSVPVAEWIGRRIMEAMQ